MRVLYLSASIVLLDQFTKLLVKGVSVPWLNLHVEGFPLGSSRPLIGDIIRLTYIENPGMAFGIDLGGKLFFSLFSVAASIGIIVYLYKTRKENFGFRLALALILAGAIGNLIDRVFYGILFGDAPLFYGRVVDFIDADFFDVNILGFHLTRWPVFNVADASVTIGVLLLLLTHRSVGRQEEPAESVAEASLLPQSDTAEPTSTSPSGASSTRNETL